MSGWGEERRHVGWDYREEGDDYGLRDGRGYGSGLRWKYGSGYDGTGFGIGFGDDWENYDYMTHHMNGHGNGDGTGEGEGDDQQGCWVVGCWGTGDVDGGNPGVPDSCGSSRGWGSVRDRSEVSVYDPYRDLDAATERRARAVDFLGTL